MTLEILEYRRNSTLVMVLEGVLDSQTSTLLLERLAACQQANEPLVVLDAAALRYVSSAGMRAVLQATQNARQAGAELAIAGLSAQNYRIFQIAGFLSALQVFPSVDEFFATRSAS